MSTRKPTIAGYREVLDSGHAAVRERLRRTPNDPELQSALRQYRGIYAMIEAMTVHEKEDPLATIDSVGIHRLAQAAETRDQEVIQFLFSYRDYCEQILRMNRDVGYG